LRARQGMDDAEQKKVIAALEKAGARLPCPRCGNTQFSLLDGYINNPIQSNLSGIFIGGPSIPAVVVACTKCGYLSQHALGALNLLPKQAEVETRGGQ
jgi:ribosomal protein S27AE